MKSDLSLAGTRNRASAKGISRHVERDHEPSTRLRRIAELNRRRAELLDQLANLVQSNPDKRSSSHLRASAETARRQSLLLTRLEEIEEAVERADPYGLLCKRMHPRGITQAAPRRRLSLVVWSLLREKGPLGLDEILDLVLEMGYRTRSPTRPMFKNCLQKAISLCRVVGLVSRDQETRQYASIPMEMEEAVALIRGPR